MGMVVVLRRGVGGRAVVVDYKVDIPIPQGVMI